VLSELEYLLSQNLIKDISFYVTGVSELVPVMEEKEFGSLFSFDAVNLPPVSKLYDIENIQDELWIKSDSSRRSVIFEETLHDFQYIEDDVVTQVVHFEYEEKSDGCYISHIDHEYIIYPIESYERRLYDPSAKGKRKVKTFKADNALNPIREEVDGGVCQGSCRLGPTHQAASDSAC